MAKGGYTLERCFLYAVASPNDLARRLHASVAAIEALAKDEQRFRFYKLKSGRDVQEPSPKLQRLHKRIHELLSRVATPEYLHSTKGRSYVTNARAHALPGPTIKLDIKAFFRSVPKKAVFRFFKERMSCAGDAAGLLAKLLTVDGHLATGSSASPVVAYYAYKAMFDELEALATANGLLMTCYVDDITMTGPGASARVLHEARRIIGRYGLRAHKMMHLKRPLPKLITGVVVDPDGVHLPHVRQQKLRVAYALLQIAEEPSEVMGALNSVMSRVNEAAQISPAKYLAKANELKRRRATI